MVGEQYTYSYYIKNSNSSSKKKNSSSEENNNTFGYSKIPNQSKANPQSVDLNLVSKKNSKIKNSSRKSYSGKIISGMSTSKGYEYIVKDDSGKVNSYTGEELYRNAVVVKGVVNPKSKAYDALYNNNSSVNKNNAVSNSLTGGKGIIEPVKKKTAYEKAKEKIVYFPEKVAEYNRNFNYKSGNDFLDFGVNFGVKTGLGLVEGTSQLVYAPARYTYSIAVRMNEAKKNKDRGLLTGQPAYIIGSDIKNFNVFEFGGAVGNAFRQDPVFTTASFFGPEIGLGVAGKASNAVVRLGKEHIPFESFEGSGIGPYKVSNKPTSEILKDFKSNKNLKTATKNNFESGGFHASVSFDVTKKPAIVTYGNSEFPGLYISTDVEKAFFRDSPYNPYDMNIFPDFKPKKRVITATNVNVERLPVGLRSKTNSMIRSGSVKEWFSASEKNPAVNFLMSKENQGKAFITPKAESAFFREKEAVITPGSIVKSVESDVGFWNKITGGTKKYTVVDGKTVFLSEAKVYNNPIVSLKKSFKSESFVGEFKPFDFESKVTSYSGRYSSSGGVSLSGLVFRSSVGVYKSRNKGFSDYFSSSFNSNSRTSSKSSFFDSSIFDFYDYGYSDMSKSKSSNGSYNSIFSGSNSSGSGFFGSSLSSEKSFFSSSNFSFFSDDNNQKKYKRKKKNNNKNSAFFSRDFFGFNPKYTKSAVVSLGLVSKNKSKGKSKRNKKSPVRLNPFEFRF